MTFCPLTFSLFDFPPFDFYLFYFLTFDFMSFDFLSLDFLSFDFLSSKQADQPASAPRHHYSQRHRYRRPSRRRFGPGGEVDEPATAIWARRDICLFIGILGRSGCYGHYAPITGRKADEPVQASGFFVLVPVWRLKAFSRDFIVILRWCVLTRA